MPDVLASRPWWHWLGISVAVIVLDLVTKAVIEARFELGDRLAVTPFFNLVLAYNKGAAFSFLANAGGWQRWFFIVLTVVVACVLLWMLRKYPGQRLQSSALALVLGGALGNLHDRILYGHVVDFIQLHTAGYYFPAFNVADSAITIGAGLLILDSFRQPSQETRHDH